ncbi:MAG TPA: SpoIID/LytB domain-containing protein [Thermoanaerobaculia bacterium]|nr:SpoIID/LytB domain-containing protein [Thermoanaerobaculia bacterium]
MRIRGFIAAGNLLLVASCTTIASDPVVGRPADKSPAMTVGRTRNSMARVEANPKSFARPIIRVGLLSDQPAVTFERIGGGYLIETPDGVFALKRGFSVAAPVSAATLRYAVQVGAISDKTSADALTERLRAEASRVDAVFDAPAGVYRIVAGDFADAESAEPLRGLLTQKGYATPMFIVKRPSDDPFTRVHRIVDDEGETHSIEAESLLVLPATVETVAIDGAPYRGGARLFINSRGLLNVINELALEEYLRGVVPNELGPKIYDELEGLKAQALAARTYAVRNLGQFRPEGFDICPTPACQVYKGFATEEPLSDRAIQETAGQIITWQGKPIDALYTSTCGGETSDVGTMFPGRSEPYLKRARCVEMDMTLLEGRRASGVLSELDLEAELFAGIAGVAPGQSWSAADAARVAIRTGELLGEPATRVAVPASTSRGELLTYLSRLWGLRARAETLTLPEDRRYYFPQSGPASRDEAQLAAAFLIKFRIVPTQQIDRMDLTSPMPRNEFYALMYNWLREHDAVRESSGKIHGVKGRELVLKADGKATGFMIPPAIPLFRRMNERSQEHRSLPVMIGDRVSIVHDRSKRPIAVVLQSSNDGASFDRTSSFANWTRSYRADELVTSIAKRNAIRQLVDIRSVARDASGRISSLEVTAEGGRTFILKGLPVRWSLNVPDNLFVHTKSTDPDGMARYTFFGKGWGHGTGMCQVGAYGMAFRGWSAEQIIKRFYAGVEIVPMKVN